jgi:hypothetical protein
MPDKPKQDEKDERIAIPLDPETALRALMRVNPEADPASQPPRPDHSDD